jgi:hypothetical protein
VGVQVTAEPSGRGTGPGRIRDVLGQLLGPQGFTLSVAGVFATLLGRWPDAGPFAIWSFVCGAGVGYALLVFASGLHRRGKGAVLDVARYQFVNVVPLAVVPAVGLCTWWIPNAVLAFALAGLLVCAGYVIGLTLSLHLLRPRRSQARSSPSRAELGSEANW